jgi:hypothetical protein
MKLKNDIQTLEGEGLCRRNYAHSPPHLMGNGDTCRAQLEQIFKAKPFRF